MAYSLFPKGSFFYKALAVLVAFAALELFLVNKYPTAALVVGVVGFVAVFSYAVYFISKNRYKKGDNR